MTNSYLWIKTFHIVLITSWFAGLFYLPRIFVNLADEKNPDAYARLLGMADRLYRFMTILAVDAGQHYPRIYDDFCGFWGHFFAGPRPDHAHWQCWPGAGTGSVGLVWATCYVS